MRVGIIAANNIRYSPYIFSYTEILKKIDVEYELIIADRYGLKENFDSVVHVLPWDHSQKTIVNYLKYTSNVKAIIRKQRYDALIILTSVNAAFLGIWLKRHYKGRYIVDIRDYSHENIYPYFLLEKIAVQNSLMNVISSRKFTEFLPQAEYSVCHNFNENARIVPCFQRSEGQITIGYVGGVSYVDQCKKLMALVVKDSRFKMEFFGTSTKEEQMRRAINEFDCDRIIFHGAYAAAEKESILQKVDILFNAYGNGIPLLDCALSNKLYDSLIYKKPILTCPGTYMTEMAGPLAYPIDLERETSLDALYDWYMRIDGHAVETFAANVLNSIFRENSTTKERIAVQLMTLNNKKG